MALDFPNSPTVGQTYPSPPIVGTPVWQWDGSEWVMTTSPAGLQDAPTDGFDYGRKNATWDKVAPLTSPGLLGTPTAPTAAVDTNTTQLATTAFVIGQAASATPIMDGSAAVGTSTRFARGDHVHPTDTSRAPVNSPTLTGTPAAPTAAVDTNTTQIATTAFVIGQASAVGDGTPAMDGTASRGTSTHWARADHVHPTDTSRAPLASPTFTGTPAAPTAAVDTNTTQLATTAFVLGQAASATPLSDGTAAVGTSTRYARADHVHPSDVTKATISGTPAANSFATWASGTAVQGVAITGLVKGNGASAPTAAVAGTDYLAPPAGTAILKANSGGALANAVAGTDYMHPGTTSNITKGFTFTPNNIGTITTGTVTPDPTQGNYQYLTNNGAFTLANPASDCAMDILVTNGASAGAITFTGFTVGTTGDTLTTTNTAKFIVSIRRINAISTYLIKALQ